MSTARAIRFIVTGAAIALFAASLRALGIQQVVHGISRIGWGFAIVLVLSIARDAARAIAWSLSIEGPGRLPFIPALRARLAGEALNTLLPMGLVAGEPAKASHVGSFIGFGAAACGLAVEFTFYTASLIILMAAGLSGFAVATGFGLGAAGMALVIGGFAATVFVHQSRRMFAVSQRASAAIVSLEILYQLLSVAEVYCALAFLAPADASMTSAVVLETVSRIVTMIFKVVPLRLGVEEAGSSLAAAHLMLSPATGISVALIRKLRLLVWGAVGLVLLVRQPATGHDRLLPGTRGILATLGIIFIALAPGPVAAQESVTSVSGTVTIDGTDGKPTAMPGVTVTLTCPGDDGRVEVSNEQGAFVFSGLTTAAKACSIVGELEGFKSSVSSVALAQGQTATVDLALRLDTLKEDVIVRATPGLASSEISGASVERIGREVMQTAPISSERFQDALPLIPGVVRGPDGLLSVNGSRATQSAVSFNSANGTDPVTGEEAVELPIDAVSSVQVRGAAYAPEFGLSGGAVTLVETQKGGDDWDVTINDLEPRVRRRGGEFRGIESWTPRVTFGGPIVKGRFNVLESVQFEYSQTQVFGLPPFVSDTKRESFESFTRGDWIASDRNRLSVSALVSPRKTTYAGLNTFNPQPVTPNVKNHDAFGTFSEQFVLGGTGVLESLVSVKQFDATIYPSQGAGPMILAPDVNSGSYFNDQDRTSRRYEWFNSFSFAPATTHLVKVGAGVAVETFHGVNRSRNVEIVRDDGTLSQLIAFNGAGEVDRDKVATRGFVQDTWTTTPRLTLQYGARYDYESITRDFNVSPRGSTTIALTADGRTILRAGGGVFYSSVPLNVASFEQFQNREVTLYAVDGLTPGTPTELANLSASRLRTPSSVNWNVEVDRELLPQLFVRAGYQERRTRNEAIVDATDAAIVLRTDGRSHYREGQVTMRYQFHGADQIVGSYTESTAAGDLNDFNQFWGNLANPVIRPDEFGPLAWDAPHRLLLWASVSLPRGFSVFPVLDARSGFPLSNVDGDRNFVGPRNGVGRFPTFISLDAQLTKRFRLFGHNATIGLKVFNITNHFNPRDYQGNLASANFGGFDNSVGRTFRGKWIFEF